MNASRLSCLVVLTVILIAFPAAAVVPGVPMDLNGDGKSDVVWRHRLNGSTYLWTMNGFIDEAALPLGEVPDLEWKIVAIDDFDGDGDSDVFWRHNVTGLNYMYIIQGGGIVDEGVVSEVGDILWKVIGTGDTNGDGKADILWRHVCSSETYVYLMNGMYVERGTAIRIVPHSWLFVGTADVNGDNMSDLIWYRPPDPADLNSDHVFAWHMSGAKITLEQRLFKYYAQYYEVPTWATAQSHVKKTPTTTAVPMFYFRRAAGDIIFHKTTGWAGWFRSVATWKIVGTGDYNGDGSQDILWRHNSTGENYMYLVPGPTTPYTGHTVTPTPDPNWQVVP